MKLDNTWWKSPFAIKADTARKVEKDKKPALKILSKRERDVTQFCVREWANFHLISASLRLRLFIINQDLPFNLILITPGHHSFHFKCKHLEWLALNRQQWLSLWRAFFPYLWYKFEPTAAFSPIKIVRNFMQFTMTFSTTNANTKLCWTEISKMIAMIEYAVQHRGLNGCSELVNVGKY